MLLGCVYPSHIFILLATLFANQPSNHKTFLDPSLLLATPGSGVWGGWIMTIKLIQRDHKNLGMLVDKKRGTQIKELNFVSFLFLILFLWGFNEHKWPTLSPSTHSSDVPTLPFFAIFSLLSVRFLWLPWGKLTLFAPLEKIIYNS